MEFHSMNESDQYRMATQECPVDLPPPPNYHRWRSFFLTLYMQVISSEEDEKRNFKHKDWDFCVIHSKHETDQQTAKSFIRLLETTLGIFGTCNGDVALGENTLQAATTMIQKSNKVFVLATRHLESQSVPKYVFHSALMQELQRPNWRRKIIPLHPRGPKYTPLFLANIEGLSIGNDSRVVELVSGVIHLEEQMQVRARRDRAQLAFSNKLRELRQHRIQEIREVISGLRREYGDDYDPNEQVTETLQSIEAIMLDDTAPSSGSGRQVINMSGCQGVSVGPSFHFYGSQRGNDDPPDFE
ncbi:uncharacterized protein [Palaemon carinicauda]|uniref:uncharacterized protein n=1 Tax=Palaemon carinicauda TaxID=392227 RepID=UPI0035B59AE4